uniref:Uncharacterized protein n=1 Tax=Rhizophora mucronata TaxID=61149 RepID=A0A2P2ND57_RHIMU
MQDQGENQTANFHEAEVKLTYCTNSILMELKPH